MPLYEYRCPECDGIFAEHLPMSESDAEFTCPTCPDAPDLKRKFGFNYKPDEPAGYCTAVGKYVSNTRQLKDEFKRTGEAYSLRTGLDSNFQPLDRREVPGLTMEGLDSTFEATGQRNTAAIERIIDNSERPRPTRKKRSFTGNWE